MEKAAYQPGDEEMEALTLLVKDHPDVALEFSYFRDELDIDPLPFMFCLSQNEVEDVVLDLSTSYPTKKPPATIIEVVRRAVERFPYIKARHTNWLNMIGVECD